jgi:hypothetical protein
MLEAFEDRRSKQKYLHTSTLTTITQANTIIAGYAKQGYKLSLRQLYYQFVARGLHANTIQNYKRLSDVLTTGRINGLVDWNAIEDRVRFLQGFGDDGSPEDAAHGIGHNYREDLWADQSKYIELWIEKDAIANVAERACSKWRVPFFACRGFASITEIYNAGKRLSRKQRREGKEVIVLHIGDHDPSGMDMTRDNEVRLGMIMRDESFQLTRIALNMDQVRRYNPPPQPNKKTDSREPGYREKHGSQSWELDALEPSVIEGLILDAVEPNVDVAAFEHAKACEATARAELQYVGRNYERARNLLLWADRENEHALEG